MRNKATSAGLPLPRFRFNSPYIDLTLYRTAEAATKSMPAEKLQRLNKSERSGWAWLATQEVVTAAEYQKFMDIPRRTALNHLKTFIDLGLLRKEGSSSATKYRIVQR